MSLIVYNSEPPSSPPEEQLYSVVLTNDQSIRTMVVHNRTTNEVSLVSPQNHPPDSSDSAQSFHGVKCPHCGAVFEEGRRRSSPQNRRDSAQDAHMGNYFKLLQSTFQLPDSLFTQGYFSKFFKELTLIGRGSRGSVYKVEHILNGVSLGTFALKKITIGQDPEWLAKVLKEVHMLVTISCNTHHLVNYNHVWLEVDSINEFGPKVPCAFILQQYCSGGNLEDLVMRLKEPQLSLREMKLFKVRRMPGRLLHEKEILVMFRSIVRGVGELHKNHIIHRDLKPSNCLLASEYCVHYAYNPDEEVPDVLIGDFGESQIEGERRAGTGATGTIEYTAPELLVDVQSTQFNKKTDSYSLGMILSFMCFGGVLPFKSGDFESLKSEIMAGGPLAHQQRDDIHEGFLELIKNLTGREQSQRLDTDEILEALDGIEQDLNQGRRLSLTVEEDVDDTVEEVTDETQYKKLALLGVQLGVVLGATMYSLTGYKQYIIYGLLFVTGLSYHLSLRNSALTLLVFFIIITIVIYI